MFETTGLRRMLDALDAPGADRVPVLVSVAALSGFAEAEYTAYEVPDVNVPQEILTAPAAAGPGTRGRETGARLATDLLAAVRPLADVVVVFQDDKETARGMPAAATGVVG